MCAGDTALAKVDNEWHYVKLVINIDKGGFYESNCRYSKEITT